MKLKQITALAVTAVLVSSCKLDGIQYDFKSYDTYKPGVVENAPETLPAVRKFEKIEVPSLEFFAVGCAGSGNQGQRLMAESMAKTASDHKPDFILYLGDNFYGRGVSSVNDPKWQMFFENIFDPSALPMPFYSILGNHDHYKNPDAQIEYSGKNPRWHMPAKYYSFERVLSDETKIGFFALDTDSILRGDKPQLDWLEEKLSQSKASWKIVYGHHPVYSSAVTYAKQTERNRQILEPVFLRHKVDLYVSSHNHSIEVLKEHSGVHYVVSGAGSRPRNVRWTDDTKFAHADIGFAQFRIHGSVMEINIVGKDGLILFSDQFTKNESA